MIKGLWIIWRCFGFRQESFTLLQHFCELSFQICNINVFYRCNMAYINGGHELLTFQENQSLPLFSVKLSYSCFKLSVYYFQWCCLSFRCFCSGHGVVCFSFICGYWLVSFGFAIWLGTFNFVFSSPFDNFVILFFSIIFQIHKIKVKYTTI